MKPESCSEKETQGKVSPSGLHEHEWVGGGCLLLWPGVGFLRRGPSSWAALSPEADHRREPAFSSSPGSSFTSLVPCDWTGVARKNRRVDTLSALMLFSS